MIEKLSYKYYNKCITSRGNGNVHSLIITIIIIFTIIIAILLWYVLLLLLLFLSFILLR